MQGVKVSGKCFKRLAFGVTAVTLVQKLCRLIFVSVDSKPYEKEGSSKHI